MTPLLFFVLWFGSLPARADSPASQLRQDAIELRQAAQSFRAGQPADGPGLAGLLARLEARLAFPLEEPGTPSGQKLESARKLAGDLRIELMEEIPEENHESIAARLVQLAEELEILLEETPSGRDPSRSDGPSPDSPPERMAPAPDGRNTALDPLKHARDKEQYLDQGREDLSPDILPPKSEPHIPPADSEVSGGWDYAKHSSRQPLGSSPPRSRVPRRPSVDPAYSPVRSRKPRPDQPREAALVEPGEKGDRVRIVQRQLNAHRRARGLAGIDVDGRFGSSTVAAVKNFQSSNGLPPTGRVDAKTWEALAALPVPPAEGSVGPKGVLGNIDPLSLPTTPDAYRRGRKGAREVPVRILPEVEVKPGQKRAPLLFISKMAIDADGAGEAWKSDPHGSPKTSLTYEDRTSLDPTAIPYIVLPIGFTKAHPEVRLGDLAAVVYKGRVAYAVFGDQGPRGQIGEGSIALARQLGIPADPRKGGALDGVVYVVFPGSGNRRPAGPQAVSESLRRGPGLLRSAGGNPK